MLPTAVTTLLAAGEVAHSAFASAADRTALAELDRMQLIQIERRGRGQRRVVVRNRAGLEAWATAHTPALPDDIDTLPARAQAVARQRNSKAGSPTHTVQPILLRWFDTAENVSPNPAALTMSLGVVAATTATLGLLPWRQPIGLLTVENWEAFHVLSAAPPSTGCAVAVYLAGHPAESVLEALASIEPDRVLHFGDYDPAGLAIFARVQRVLPTTRLFVPADIDALFARYAQHILLANAGPLDSADPAVQHVQQLIAHYNAGLEQEIVPGPTAW